MSTYAYIRVSAEDQNLDRQRIAMREAGVPEGNVIAEKQSGKDFERPQYMRLVRRLREGDTLVIQSIDRLGRDYDGIIDQWRALTKKGVGIVVLDMPLLDTSRDRDLTGRLIADIVLQLLSYVAQTERERIRKRQAEGIAAAKERGVRFGREPLTPPPQYARALRDYKSGECSAREAAAYCGVSHKTFLKWTRQEGEKAT